MPIEEYLAQTLGKLEALYREMDPAAGPILFREVGPYRQFRHEQHTESLVCYLKGLKAISTLNACLILLRAGHAQEVGALCRMVDDFCNEIFFLLVPQVGDKFSEDQIRFVENFFQEELERPEDPLGSPQKRATVPMKKVFATFGKLAADELNPSDAQEMLRTVHQAFSGYIHGAYPQIMEMFGGNPPHYHLTGMLGTPRIEEWRAQLVGYVHRLVMTSYFVARKMDKPELETPIRALLEEFENETGTKPQQKASEMLTKMKRKRAT